MSKTATKVTTIHGSVFGVTSFKRAASYVASGRAVWVVGSARQGHCRQDVIRFLDADHRNKSAVASMERKVDARFFVPVKDMMVSGTREMKHIPVIASEKLLYKIPAPKRTKPFPVLLLRSNGAIPGMVNV